MPEREVSPMETPDPQEMETEIGFAIAALGVPLLSGCILLFVTSFAPILAISVVTVIVSSVLLAIDAGRLGNIDLKGQKRESALLLFFGICAMWIIGYPFAFFRRKHFGGPNLGIPSILIALFFVGAPILRAILVPPSLPACNSREVVQLLEQVIRSTPAGTKARSVDGHREVSYDKSMGRRLGQCDAHTDGGNIVVNYIVQWRDRAKGQYEVRIPPPELPSCTSREVVQLLEQIIRSTPTGTKARSVDGHREVNYDKSMGRRLGQCVMHTDVADIVINFLVQWRDRDKGQFEIQIKQ